MMSEQKYIYSHNYFLMQNISIPYVYVYDDNTSTGNLTYIVRWSFGLFIFGLCSLFIICSCKDLSKITLTFDPIQFRLRMRQNMNTQRNMEIQNHPSIPMVVIEFDDLLTTVVPLENMVVDSTNVAQPLSLH